MNLMFFFRFWRSRYLILKSNSICMIIDIYGTAFRLNLYIACKFFFLRLRSAHTQKLFGLRVSVRQSSFLNDLFFFHFDYIPAAKTLSKVVYHWRFSLLIGTQQMFLRCCFPFFLYVFLFHLLATL